MRQSFVQRLARKARTAVRGDRSGPWRIRTDPVRGRRRALDEESGYWADWLEARGGKFADDFTRRFDPGSEVNDPELREVLAGIPGAPAVLDVGAGPLSSVGARVDGRRLELVAVDPLADSYDRALRRLDLDPPVRTRRVAGEELTSHFGAGKFDVAYARNALDHAVDPAVIVEEMLGVVRPGGAVVLHHIQNEGERNQYAQLHQWNFDVVDDHLIVWRSDRRVDLTDRLQGRAEVHCALQPVEGGYPVVVARLIRR